MGRRRARPQKEVMMQDNLLSLEEKIAHLTRMVDDLSEIVARQADQIDLLSRRVGLLMERAAEGMADNGTIPLTDQRPPHW
jgi:SlyX protein